MEIPFGPSGPFKASKKTDNKQRKVLGPQPLKPKGQNEQQAKNIVMVEEILARTAILLKQIPMKPKKDRKPKERKEEVHSGKGYVYTYDAEGKPIPKSRVLMEAKLGRPLYSHEVVIYLDKDRRNCEIENLAVGFKGNSPITLLQCTHCGAVGEISLLQADIPDSPDC